MRRDVTFLSKGQHCTGWLYIPDPSLTVNAPRHRYG